MVVYEFVVMCDRRFVLKTTASDQAVGAALYLQLRGKFPEAEKYEIVVTKRVTTDTDVTAEFDRLVPNVATVELVEHSRGNQGIERLQDAVKAYQREAQSVLQPLIPKRIDIKA